MRKYEIEMLEEMLKTIHPYTLVIALGNAFCHGDMLRAHNVNLDDGDLGRIHDSIDSIRNLIEKDC